MFYICHLFIYKKAMRRRVRASGPGPALASAAGVALARALITRAHVTARTRGRPIHDNRGWGGLSCVRVRKPRGVGSGSGW
jgi:hypothetical protein